MIFNTFSYFLFFLFPTALAFRVASPRFKAPLIACSGALFYLFFSLTAVGGWAGALCLMIFLWEAFFSRLYRAGSRWCMLGIVQAVIFLLIFKYRNFVVGLLPASFAHWHWQGAFLPLGISFFTFEFIHYAQDRRLGRAEQGTVWEYLSFILFFPTLVAGPIKRYQDYLATLRNPSVNWAADWERGLTRILSGLAKKFVIADLMTSLTVHLNAADIAQAQRWVLPLWLLAYAVQIYVDFSAYSDIAIGSSRLFGLTVKENFDWPYLRTDIASFWSHWHMSLTKWLRDYVFIPMGGSRVSVPHIYLNVIVTMLVSGLWHGAGLNFLVWGLWHGAALSVHRLWSHRSGRDPNPTPTRLGLVASWALTFTTVVLGWAWFVMDIPTALFFFRRLLLG